MINNNFIKCLREDNEGSEWDVFLVVKKNYEDPLGEIHEDQFVCDHYADHMGGTLIITKNKLMTTKELENPMYIETSISYLNNILDEYFDIQPQEETYKLPF